MKKLDIVIPHHGEPWEVCRNFFDMLRLQLCADRSEIRVMMIHDGSDFFPEELLEVPGIRTEQHRIAESGVSAARNFGLEISDAEWVMFCDCDDMFASVWALHCILEALDRPEAEKNDMLWYPFYIEESAGRNVIGQNWVFIHGKIYRREFLNREGIRFHTDLYYAEDSAFNAIVEMAIDRERIGRIESDATLYVWVYNRQSVTSRPENRLRNALGLFDRHVIVANEYRRRGDMAGFRGLAARATWDGFYQCHRTDVTAEQLTMIREKVARYYLMYAEEIDSVDPEWMEVVRKASRKEALGKGFVDVPATLFPEWIAGIKEEYGGGAVVQAGQ